MADYSWRTIESRVREYSLPSPTNGTQVRQVLARMDDELGPEAARWDTAITVTAGDDEILFTYPIATEVVTGHRDREQALARQLQETARQENETARAARALREAVIAALSTAEHSLSGSGGLRACSCGHSIAAERASEEFITHILAVTRARLDLP